MPSPCPGCPEARAELHDERRREQTEEEAADGRLAPRGDVEVGGRLLHAAQRREEQAAHERHDDREQRVERQMLRHERVARGVREEGALAEDGDEHRVAHDAREDARHERVGLEVVAVEHLDGEERRAERRAEDGGHARGRPRDEQDAPLARRDLEKLPDERPDGAAHLHRRPLAAAGPARAEGERRHDGLHEGDALAHHPVVLVERLDDGVAAAAAGLGGEPRGDRAGDEGPGARHDHEQPRAKARERRHLAEDLLAARAQRLVPGPRLEGQPLHGLDADEEERAEEPRRGADEGRAQQGAPEDLKLERGPRGAEQRAQGRQPPCRAPWQARGAELLDHRR